MFDDDDDDDDDDDGDDDDDAKKSNSSPCLYKPHYVKTFAIFYLEMTMTLVAMGIVTIFCVLYESSVSFLSWATFHGSMTNRNGFIHNTIMIIPIYMKCPGKRQ